MNDTPTPDLRHAEQQMLMARPWHGAEPDSIWEITGDYAAGAGTFTTCLAMVLPESVTGGGAPLFKMLGALASGSSFDVVTPAQITQARPLLLVHRDDPSTPYWEDDRVWMRPPGGAA